MKRYPLFLGLLVLVMFAVSAYADKSELPRDLTGAKLQGFAPNGREDINLTVNSTTVDMRSELAWAVYAPGACKFRIMTTATKVGLTRTIPAATRLQHNVHPRSPYVNYSGCTSGELQRQ